MNGITYYRLNSEYVGDYTKGVALSGIEVDGNFHTLEGRDIASIAVVDKDLVVTLLNGDTRVAKGAFDIVFAPMTAITNVSYDQENGVMTLTNANGETQEIGGFIKLDDLDFKYKLAVDGLLSGEGNMGSPLRLSPLARTGQYKPVYKVVYVENDEHLPHVNVSIGDRYLTSEKISHYGYLYNYSSVKKIMAELRDSDWRVPSKEDWDDMLNSIEPCELDKDHSDTVKSELLGRWAGKLLKSKNLWEPYKHHDCDCNCNIPPCDCHENETTMEEDYNCTEECVYPHDPEENCSNGCTEGGTHECEYHHHHNMHEYHLKEFQGLDSYGMTILPVGMADDNRHLDYIGQRCAYWTATANSTGTKAYVKGFWYNKNSVYQDVMPTNYYFSLRLVKDYDGQNYKDVEHILDSEYPTVLMPSNEKGQTIWTSCNIAYANPCVKPLSPDGNGSMTRRRFFINEWDGHNWLRNEVKEGESVVVLGENNNPIEYRVVNEELVSVNSMIYDAIINNVVDTVSDELMPVLEREKEKRIEKDKELQEGLNNVSDALTEEVNNRIEVDNQQWDAINNEIANREEVESQLWTAVNNEIETRESEDNKIQDTLLQEIQDRIDVDTQQWEAINTALQSREDEDKKIYEAIAQEVNDRITVDTQQWEAINNEIEIREEQINERVEVDNEQWDRINENTDMILTEEGTEFNETTGELTLKSKGGVNDIKVQFSFDFGTF